ncbi:hypothetical protein OHA72_48145 [Dactylosporangium sp. NBC_01737]|uniref:hypothetical protein n=1 Tax=Dactylosporangium sp. NBC_01737 TaxID=2975959 RepID=UPI002E0D5723|nr:hypothetical protein OHA72_48145 [Dactylosporangium sp. NBC_01737]
MGQSETLIVTEALGHCERLLVRHGALNTVQKFSGAPDKHLKNVIRLKIFRWQSSEADELTNFRPNHSDLTS